MKRLLPLLLLLAATPTTRAQSARADVDSTLYAYYRWINNHIEEPVVLLKADTLFDLAREKGDVRMQTVALNLKADHYYHRGELDSLKAWIPRVQRFARSRDQLTYYYFVWTRLVLFYTKQGQYTLSQYELERMIAQARRDDYKPALAEAYKHLGHIYFTRSLYASATDYYQKSIDFIEQNDPKRFSLWNLYLNQGIAYVSLGDFAQAEKALLAAERTISLPEYVWTVKREQAVLYARMGDRQKALALLGEVRQKNNGTIPPEKMLEAEAAVYGATGDRDAALRSLDRLIESCGSTDEASRYQHYKNRANIYASQGNYRAAYEDLRRYSEHCLQQVAADNERSLGEFATLLDVERLDRENAALQRKAQEQRLRRTHTVLAALVAILLLAACFIVVMVRLNRRLARAKRAAEASSRMKDIFIRNITHEVNTPLNAIVGFAELAATAEGDAEERRSYIDILRQNSRRLQKLIDDVLYLSNLDTTQTAPQPQPTDLDALCRKIVAALPEADKARVRFVPGPDRATLPVADLYLAKALGELLSNALRFTCDEHITLDYEISRDRNRATFRVTDRGEGIPPHERQRIFERFVKLDPFSDGLGLGLAVCRRIAESPGGTLRLDESHSGGSRFVLTLPIPCKSLYKSTP